MSILVNNSNYTSVILKQAFHANSGADKTWAGSNSYISIHYFEKLPNTYASNNVSPRAYKSW